MESKVIYSNFYQIREKTAASQRVAANLEKDQDLIITHATGDAFDIAQQITELAVVHFHVIIQIQRDTLIGEMAQGFVVLAQLFQFLFQLQDVFCLDCIQLPQLAAIP